MSSPSWCASSTLNHFRLIYSLALGNNYDVDGVGNDGNEGNDGNDGNDDDDDLMMSDMCCGVCLSGSPDTQLSS